MTPTLELVAPEPVAGEALPSSLERLPWRNGVALIGLLWAAPIPVFSLAIDLHARELAWSVGAIISCLKQHWIHWFAIAHLPLFTLVFGVVGGVLEASARRSQELVAALTGTVAELESESARRAALERDREEFISNLTHELRTPLSSTCAYAEMMLQGRFGDVTTRQSRALKVGLKNLRSLEILIDSMLQMARLEAGKVSFVRLPFPLSEVLEDVCATLEASAQAKGVTLNRNLAEAHLEVLGDRDGVRTVLLNLLGNAVKFTDAGGTVAVEARPRPGGNVSVAVSDTGIGIPETSREVIFQRFRQLDPSRTRRHGGAGLGLAIVKRILDAQGLAIELESTVGRGSTFRFELPAATREGGREEGGTLRG